MSPVSKETLAGLTAGINSEIAAYVFYVEASRKDISSEARTILEDLALEEKQHFQVLERQHHSLIKSEQWVSIADILKSDDLPEISEEMTSTHRELIDEVKNAGTLLAILDIAYKLEVEAYELFILLGGKVDTDEGKRIFNELARFEQGHMRKIDSMRKELC